MTLAALGHNYANGTCSRCGAADPDYSAGSAVVGAESVTVHPGDTFSIPVVIRNNPGFAGFSFGAVYDSNALTLTAIDQGSLMTNTMVFYGSPENGEVVWAGTKNVTGDGDLYILTFTVSEDAAEGEYSIQTVLKGNDTGNFTNDSYEPVPVTFQSGTVKVTKLVYGDLNGDTKVNVTDLVRFARSLVSMETLTDTQRQAADVNLDGKTNVTDAVIIARYLVGSVKELPYQPAAATAFRMSSAPRNTSVSISADTVQANAGDTVTVPVNISNNTGIAGFNLKFTYDTDALTLTAINGGSLLANTMVFMGSTENSEVVWAGTQNITGDGELVKLTFTVNEQAKNGKYPISISLKNDDPGSLTDESYEPVPATFAPGAIQVGEHTHVWSGWHTVTDTTCTEAGLEIRSCTECDEEESRTVAAKGHKTEVRNAKEATCTEDGYTGDTECTVCGETIERGAVIMAPGHKTEVRNAREATCTEDGYTGDTVCTVCDITVEQGTVTKASGHRTEVRNAKEAACTEDGYTGDTVCTVCSETIERGAVITAPGHKTEVRNAKEATCTEDGYTGDTVCTVCSETIEKGAVIKASGHKTEVHNAKEATCTENGYTGDTVCTACSETIEQGTVITAPGHKTEVRNAKEATCTEDGYTGDTVCTVCSITVEQGAVTKAPGHRTEIRNAKEATCTEDGYTGDTVCKACGITMEQGKTVPSKGHKTEVRNAKEATCTENGYSGDMVCTVCGETLERGTVISATGHNWGAWIVTKEPTDFENGEQERSCTRCGATEREVLPALKHTHALTFIPSQSADCTMSGHIAYWICERCGGIYADSEGTRQLTESDIKLPALGHDWEEHVHFKAPTLFKPGYTGDTVCSRCGEIKEKGRVIPPLGISTVPSPDKPSAPMNFTDVKTGDWFYGDVKYVYENGLMNGASETRFDPNGTLTRAMMVTILYRMEGEPAVRFNGQFTDAPDYQWYTGAVEWAAKKGIVTGYDDGRFGPNDPVTREQLAAILYRYAQYKGNAMTAGGSLSAYKDGSTVSAYANEAVRWAVAEGLLNGSDGRLLPRAQASRAQVAAIIRRFLEK